MGAAFHAGRTAALVLLGAALGAPTRSAAQAPALWGALDPGPHVAGFRTERHLDPARTYPGSPGGRPVALALWYPARGGSAPRMRIRDYAHLLAAAEGAEPRTAAERRAAERRALATPFRPGVPARYDSLLALGTRAVREAPAAPGRYPVVVLGTGWSFESPLAQVVLAEYLASHGHVVVSPVLRGTRSPLVSVDAADLETAVRDLEVAAARVRALPAADPERLALAGFDLGGMAVTLLAMRHEGVDAVVSLDSGILSDRLMRDLMRRNPFYDLGRLRAPLLHATRSREENLARGLGEDRAVFDSAGAAPRYLLRISGMRHADFAIHGMIEGVLPAFWGPVQGAPNRGHEALLRWVERFLAAHVRGDAAARDFLRRDPPTGVPEGVGLTVERTGARPVRPTADEVAHAVLEGPAGRAEALVRAGAAMDEAAFRRLGYELLYRRGEAAGAARVLGWAAEALPGSAAVQAELGEALLAAGDRARALAAFRRAAELDPANEAARARIAELERQGAR